MTEARDGGELALDFRDGWTVVVLGAEGPAGSTRLLLPPDPVEANLIVMTDPSRPSRITSLWVGDADRSATTIDTLLGPGMAEALARAGGFLPRSAIAGSLESDSRSWNALCRLALATWNETWSPLNVPRNDALLDVAIAADEAGEVGIAGSLFEETLPSLLAYASRCADVAPSAITERLARAVAAAEKTLGPHHEESTQLHAASELLGNSTEVADYPPDWTEDWLSHGAFAFVGSVMAGLQDAATTGVDWDNVPARVVDTHEAAISVKPTADGVEIRVDAHPQLTDIRARALTLLVRLVDRETAEPIAAAFLTWDVTSRCFVADVPRSRLSDYPDPRALIPDVYSADALGAAATGQLADRKRARRWAIRSVCTARLAAALQVLDPGSPSVAVTWEQAEAAAAQAQVILRRLGEAEPWQEWLALLGKGSSDPISTLAATVGQRDSDSELAGPLLSELLLADRLLRSA